MKRNIVLILSLGLVVSVPAHLYCQKIENVGGTRIIHNEKAGNKLPVSIELVRTIGDVDTADENFAFNYPEDITTDTAGNIYVLDSANNRIQKFGPDVKFLTTFGRKGQGPGEFYNPDSFGVDSKGFFWIMDGYQNRIQTLTPDGKGDKTIPLKERFLRRMRVLKSGLLAVQGSLLYTSFNDKSNPPKLLKLLDQEGKSVRELVDIVDFGEPATSVAANSINYDVDANDNIIVSFRAQNRIEKYAPDGKLLWRADRPLRYDTEIIKKGKIEQTGGGGLTIKDPQMNICSGGIASDIKGRIWVVAYSRQLKKEEQVRMSMGMSMGQSGTMITRKTTGNTELRTTDAFRLDIFNPDGVLLGEIPLTHFVDGIRICGEHLFLLDQVRGVTYYQYKIEEN